MSAATATSSRQTSSSPRELKVPIPWERLQRAETRKLIALEKKTVVTVRRTVRVVTAVAVAQVIAHPDAEHAAILAIVMMASKRMQRTLAADLREARERARLLAIGRTRAEFQLAGLSVSVLHTLAPRKKTDAARADAAAASLASGWASSAVYLTGEAERAREPFALSGPPPAGGFGIRHDAARALTQAEDIKASAFELAVSTEVPRAYNDQHREDGAELVRAHPDIASILVRQWDARLDACPRCAGHDGETTEMGGSFKGGDEPGYMHPRCRCESSLVPVTLH